MQCACALLFIHLSLSFCTMFSHTVSQTARFKESTQHKFLFSPQLLSETFLILRRTERDMIIYVYRSACTVHPSMALQPLPGLGLPHKTPPFISIRSSSPPSSYPQQLYCIPLNHIRPSISWSSHWSCGMEVPFRTFFGIPSSSILII